MTQVKEYLKWMFHVDNVCVNLPYINGRDYTIIKQIVNMNKKVEDRVNLLKACGYDVKRCYIPTYHGILQPTYMSRLNEIRLTIGRPKNHFCREVYAIIIKPHRKI